MIEYELLRNERILIVHLCGKLSKVDCESLGWVIDRYGAEQGNLMGLLFELGSFTAWDGMEGFAAYHVFLTQYLGRFERFATLSRKVGPADLGEESDRMRHFRTDERDHALAWLAGTV